MKKVFAVLVAAVFGFLCASAGDFKDYTHWSVALHGGISQFDGDAVQDYNQMFSNSQVLWIIGVEGEYTWNPYWGLVAQFEYIPYMGKTSGSYGKNTFKGWSCDPSLMVSVNVLNLFGQYRKDWHWGLYVKAGVGMSFYGVDTQVTEGEEAYGKDATPFNDGRCIMFPMGVDLEYNINKWLAVNLSGSYRMHNKDNFEGEDYTRGTSNDAMFTVTAGLRVKLAPNKKQGHVRNTSMYDYHQHMLGDQSNESIDSLRARVAQLEEEMADNEKWDNQQPVASLDSASIKRLSDQMNECCSNSQQRIQELEKQIAELSEQKNGEIDLSNLPESSGSIFFALNKTYITLKSKKTVAEIADSLKRNPSWDLLILGYSDAPGDDAYNMQVSQQRVDVVIRNLKDLGVDESRIRAQAKGAIPDPETYEPKNRRCDFYIIKK
ncbi:MAG: OmpA family protein [Paludibacteraceae bacterium]|nr:OmpA family protein [Paludibacteraceae bacterium]